MEYDIIWDDDELEALEELNEIFKPTGGGKTAQESERR